VGTALVFPGQGSQREGMAAPWRDKASFDRWEEAGDVLGWDVRRLGLDAAADELREPANCQVALFVHGVVLLEAWKADGGASPVVVAGHSLGEYDALVAAGVLSFADALRLVDVRARATQSAADERPGGMVACLGHEVDDVAAACAEAGAFVANDNAPGQIVAAGPREALEGLKERLAALERPRGKVVDVAVGAAYHSPHMEPAVETLGAALDQVSFAEAAVPVVANVDATAHTTAADWPGLLRAQLTAPVRWRESVAALAGAGASTVVELGASQVLTSLVKRTDRSLGRQMVKTPDDLRDVIEELGS
jgi:[acyl-carrier-protein] S-malonyltransferase